MIHKAYVLSPETSLYHVQHHFALKVSEALGRMNLSCQLLEGTDRVSKFLQDPPDFSLCFNGAVKFSEDRFYCDVLRIPHVSCLIDPAFHFFQLIHGSYMIVTCDDLVSCELLHALGFSRAFFMPHGVERELAPNPELIRKYDVVMLATFIDCEKRRKRWRGRFSTEALHAMEKSIEASLGVEQASFLTVLLDILFPNWKAGEIDRVRLKKLVEQNVFEEVEQYIKGRDRLDLIKAAQEHTVHVFGDSVDTLNWKKYFKDTPNVVVHPSVSYLEALEVMKQSKIVLNSCIKNIYGAHERIFSAAACGAAVVTNDNVFLREHFIDGKEMVLFQRANFAKVNESIHELLTDEKKRSAMAEAGRAKVMNHHTWDHRMRQLLLEITSLIENMRKSR